MIVPQRYVVLLLGTKISYFLYLGIFFLLTWVQLDLKTPGNRWIIGVDCTMEVGRSFLRYNWLENQTKTARRNVSVNEYRMRNIS